jgi:thiamine pyrophosphate-dependent acetolactate synthase large subunit-like protein
VFGSAGGHHLSQGLDLGLVCREVRFPDTDFAALGHALGAEGLTVRRPDDLGAVEAWLARRDRSLVVDAKINPEICAEWLEEAFRGH